MKKTAYIGCLGMIGVITTEFGVIGILPQIADYYSISVDQAGWLLSAFALVIATTGPFMTLFTSGINRKKIMMGSIALFLFTGVISTLSPPFWLLMTVRILPAFLQPVYISTAIAAAVSNVDKKKEHQYMGIVLGGIAISMVTTVPFATYIASIYQWQGSFVVQTIVTIIALVAIFKGLPSMPVKEKKSYGNQLRILTKPDFVISIFMNFLMIAAWFSTYSYFADFLGKVKGMNEGKISSMMLLFGITGIAGNWLAGKLLSKSVPLTTAAFLLGTMLIPFGLYYSGSNATQTIVCIAVWGFLYAPCFLTAAAYLISAAPDALEFANSLAVSSGNLGVALGTAVSGWFIAHQGIQISPWVGMAFGFASLLMILLRSQIEARQKKQVTLCNS